MRFNEESGLVKLWVILVQNGTYTRGQVPDIYNLRDVVFWILDGKE